MFTIYCVTHTRTGKMYVGQTRRSPRARLAQHFSEAHTTLNGTYFHRALRKYGREAFALSVLEVVPTAEEADEAEKRWISNLHTRDHRIGYNLEIGGKVKAPHEETRRKQSEAQKRRFSQPGALERLSAAVRATHPGIPASTRAALSLAHLGHTRNRGVKRGPQTEGHRTKIAASRAGRNFTHQYRVQQMDPQGSVVATYPSLTRAAKVVGCASSTIARCARGKTPLAAGFRWQFVGLVTQNY